MLLFRVKPRHVEKFQKCRFADVGKSELGKKRKKKHAQNIYMILYASDVTDPTKSVLAMLDNLIDRAVVKILKSQKIVLFMKLDTSLDCIMLHPCVKRGI